MPTATAAIASGMASGAIGGGWGWSDKRKVIPMPRFWPFGRKKERVVDIADIGRLEDRPDLLSTPQARRFTRRDIDLVAIYGAVYAAIRKRSLAITKPELVLLRHVGDKALEEPKDHPALAALYRVNESLTYHQGVGLIEQHKLSVGPAYWIKRRNNLGTPVEFEIWPPQEVEVVADKQKPWVPALFKRHRANGTTESVEPKDVIWFRHMVDPRNPLRALSPIGAIRTELDTGMEARRFNQLFFDHVILRGQLFDASDAGEGEIKRIEKELRTRFASTDNAWRPQVVSGDLKPLDFDHALHKDMEFLAQLNFGLEEVCRVFEIPPEMMGAGNRTYANLGDAEKAFWGTMADQFDLMMDEFNEFYIWPDFGPEYELVGRYDKIAPLQEDKKQRAELDETYLKNAVTTVNEVREREGMEAVPWGDTPLVPNTVVPLTMEPPTTAHSLERSHEEDMEKAWQKRLSAELRALIAHLEAADKRDIQIGDVDNYDWDWLKKYGKDVEKELSVVYLATLEDKGFVPSPMLTAQKLASKYAKERGAELLKLTGRESVVKVTKNWVKGLTVQTIEQGESLNTLTKNLRQGFQFSKARATRIAITETRTAVGQASIKSYESQGVEGKQWSTAGDGRVCDICATAEGDGAIPLHESFSNGLDTVPAHPSCRCNIDSVYELPRASVFAQNRIPALKAIDLPSQSGDNGQRPG